MTLDKRRASAAVLVPAAVLVGSTTQTWVAGATSDVLRHGAAEVTGSQAAPGVVGVSLVCVAALLGLLTGGRLVRVLSAGALVLASLAAVALVLLVVLRPQEAVAAEVARELARTTPPSSSGHTTVLGWLASGAAAVLAAAAVATVVASRSWTGLSDRYDRPDRAPAGPRGEVRTPWDELSEGGDPTLRDGPGST